MNMYIICKVKTIFCVISNKIIDFLKKISRHFIIT